MSVFKRRSELSGTDLSRQTFHIRMIKQVSIPQSQTDSTITVRADGTRMGSFSVLESLFDDDQWQQYSKMYDQYRIAGVRASFELVGMTTEKTTTTAFNFASAIDRNGLPNPPAEGITISARELQGMSSYLPSIYYSGNKFKQTRTFYPSTVLEKSQYMPTDVLQPWIPSGSVAQFNPWIYFMVSDLGNPNGVAATNTFTIVVNFDVACTFRALRLNNRRWSP